MEEDPVVEERRRGNAGDRLAPKRGQRLPRDWLTMPVENEVDVALCDGRRRLDRMVLLLLEDGPDVDDELRGRRMVAADQQCRMKREPEPERRRRT
jgi:hypothetical protein